MRPRWRNSIGFAKSTCSTRTVADDETTSRGRPRRLDKPQPAGLLRGRVDDPPQRLRGRRAGAWASPPASRCCLPAVGFALAPVFDEEGDDWQAVGPADDFTRRPTSRW